MAATTTLLGLVTPTQGTLSGTWGDTVNYGISDYVDISVAGTLTLTNDGAVTLANTTGSSAGNSITSSLTGAGTVTAQFAIVRVTGTLTVAKVVTGPSYSKTYTVVNAATGGIVTFKASGQTGVSVAVGESAFVYFNGTDYVKIVGTATAGAAGGSTTQVQYNNAGVLAGITGATTNGTALTLVAPILGTPASATLTNATGLPISTGVSGLGTGVATFLATPSSANLASAVTDETGSGALVFATSPTLVTPTLGVATATSLQGIIGNVTPAAGAFTTVTASTAIGTASGGTGLGGATPFTSSGVVYASSTSALATGSALTFDGINFGGSVNVMVSDNKAIGFGFNAYWLGNSANGFLAGYINGSEGLRLKSTGLGIGTSSPGAADWNASATVVQANKSDTNGGLFKASSSNTNFIFSAGNNLAYIATTTNTPITFYTNTVERARIDHSGNFGLGVTPNGTYKFQNSGNTFTTGITISTGGGTNEANTMNIDTDGAGAARYYSHGANTSSVGYHVWHLASSNGSIDTSAMTLDTSGNLLVGGTAQSGTANRVAVFSANKFGLSIIDTTAQTTGVGGALNLGGNYRTAGDAQAFARVAAVKQNSTDADYGYGMSFSVTPNGGTFTEAARIDSSGNLLVGTTSAGDGKVRISANANAFNILKLDDTGATGGNYIQFLNSSGSNAGTINHVSSTAVLYNTTSDYRLKNVTNSVTGQGARIDALKPIDYQWKEGGQQARGFLAHQFQEVYASSVTGTKDAVDADGNPVYQGMQASSAEVIADLVAEIQSLRQRLSAANL